MIAYCILLCTVRRLSHRSRIRFGFLAFRCGALGVFGLVFLGFRFKLLSLLFYALIQVFHLIRPLMGIPEFPEHFVPDNLFKRLAVLLDETAA